MTYINELAPKMMSEKEIKKFIQDEIVQMSLGSKGTPFNKGELMKRIMPKLKGKADGKLINQIVSHILSGGL